MKTIPCLWQKFGDLGAVNSQTAKQFFSWADAFVAGASAMAPAVFRVFMLVLCLCHWYNLRVCGAGLPRPKRMTAPGALRGGSRASPHPVPHDADTAAAAPAAGPAAAPQLLLNLRHNPHGVGYWLLARPVRLCRLQTCLRS